MNFDDIPTYTGTRVDPDDPEPTGVFDLRDCLDFRPTVANITGASDTVTRWILLLVILLISLREHSVEQVQLL